MDLSFSVHPDRYEDIYTSQSGISVGIISRECGGSRRNAISNKTILGINQGQRNPGRATPRMLDGCAVDGGSRLTLSLEFSGFLSFLICRLTRGLSQSYIVTEAQKLQERSER